MTATALGIEQRRFSRIPLHCPGVFQSSGRKTRCEVVDVSLRGVRLQVPADTVAEEGQLCVAILQLDSGAATLRMRGAVAHRSGEVLAVRCHEMDLDSLAHLRRILELNLARSGWCSRSSQSSPPAPDDTRALRVAPYRRNAQAVAAAPTAKAVLNAPGPAPWAPFTP